MSPTENVTEPPNFDESSQSSTQQSEPNISQTVTAEVEPQETTVKVETLETVPEIKTEPEPEPSAFDLLSGIDFTVEQKPLVPEIKVPQISESVIKKPTLTPKAEPVVKSEPKEEVLERPAKRDVFTDPMLLNKFTEEVKNLQKFVDSLTNKTASGLTVLDSKWKTFQDVQVSGI